MTDIAPLVSVVIATNRGGRFLSETIESVRMQTHPSVELIVVDDGSPDPEAIAAAVADYPDVHLVRLPAAGVSIARNIGAAAASGSYLAFLDDDDRWHPDRLAAGVARLEADPSYVLAYCGMRAIDATGRVLADADQVAVADRFDVARRATGILLPNIVVRAEAFTAVGGFHSRIRLAEDFDLVLRLAERGPFAFEPEALVDYRTHGANTTRRHRELARGIDAVLRLHRWAASERDDQQLVEALDESIRKNERFAWWSAVRAARAALTDRHPGEASGEIWWALRTAPRGLASGMAHRVAGGPRERRVSGGD